MFLITSWFSAIYNGVIIAIYITGSLCALFTILKKYFGKKEHINSSRTPVEKIAFFLTSIRFLFAGAQTVWGISIY